MLTKLLKIQTNLKAPKNQFNSFGKYHYRNCEDIFEVLKPLLAETLTTLTIQDEIINIGTRYYIKATATLHDIESEKTISTTALAREEESKKGMDGSQVTGASSSYARKYALNGLFAIDDTKDADATQKTKESDFITEDQQKRLFAIAKGNTQLAKEVILTFGITSSKDILKNDYDKICKKIEDGVTK